MKKSNNIKNVEDSVEDIPGYDSVEPDEDDLEEAHSFIDGYSRTAEDIVAESLADESNLSDVSNAGNNGYDSVNLGDDTIDRIDIPDSIEVAAHKYNIEPDIAQAQRHDFDPNRAFFGRHVVNSNTKRTDNFRHLMQMDLIDDYDMIPTRRQRANQIRQRVTGEFQMARSNPEVGGFDRKLQRSVIKKEDVDVKQSQTLDNKTKVKKKKFFGMGR